MKNLGNLMKQAQQMQSKMVEMQEKLGELEVSGAAGWWINSGPSQW